MTTVELLHFDGCPNWQRTAADLDALALELGFSWNTVRVRVDDDLQALGFRGSPTVLVDGIDPFATPGMPYAFACRMYRGPHGVAGHPSRQQLRQALGG